MDHPDLSGVNREQIEAAVAKVTDDVIRIRDRLAEIALELTEPAERGRLIIIVDPLVPLMGADMVGDATAGWALASDVTDLVSRAA